MTHAMHGSDQPAVRPEVSALLGNAGYRPHDDGSNGWLWVKSLDDGTTLDIRCRGGRENPLDGDPTEHEWTVERYGPRNAYVNVGTGWTLAGAISAATRLPYPYAADGRPLNECHRTMAEAIKACRASAMVDVPVP